MQLSQQKLILSTALLVGLSLLKPLGVYAAQPLDLNHQSLRMLQPLFATQGTALTEINRQVDFNQTLHLRFQETYFGYPVWGADAVLHIPNGAAETATLAELIAANHSQAFLTGVLYQQIQADLGKTPVSVFTTLSAQQALQKVVQSYQRDKGSAWQITEATTKLIVFIDNSHQAHWAYRLSFYAKPAHTADTPEKPIYIIDAITATLYQHWNDIKTQGKIHPVAIIGGGFGGNEKMGQLVYDGLPANLAALNLQRDAASETCFLQNTDVTIKDYGMNGVVRFPCATMDAQHHLYWDANFDTVNGGHSPANDALSAGTVIKKMYQDWYGLPVLTNENGSPMKLKMIVHVPYYENAYWDGQQMVFGNGDQFFYPLTSLGVGAHEISHGFTEQHSNLIYEGQSGAMNESFSDMAAQAAEWYSYGKNSWQIGAEIVKQPNVALRYLDQPSKDCQGARPGDGCSIDDATQYQGGLDVHYSSGVYNHFFYLLGTTSGWDAKKAFAVMVQANAHYWTARTTFAGGACGVLQAVKDLARRYPQGGFAVEDVKQALDGVKVDYRSC